MKKYLILLIATLCIATTTTTAQNRVRGVETKLVKYEGPSYEKSRGYSTSWFGYSFYNMNSIPVSVDAKLYQLQSVNRDSPITTLIETKTFVLESKEAYVWKFEANDDFQAQDKLKPYKNAYMGGLFDPEYYVEYEAYKLE